MYRHITPITEGTCPICGSIGYLQEDDDSGETLYTAWCGNMECRGDGTETHFKTRVEAEDSFLNRKNP